VYGWRWRRAMRTCDLSRPARLGVHDTPHLGTVWSSRWTDTLSVHPLDGQDATAFTARAERLARAFGALSCDAHDDPTGVVRLEVRRGDPLGGPVQLRRYRRAPTGPRCRSACARTAHRGLLVLHDLARWGPTIERPVHDRLVAALDLILDYGPSLGVVVVVVVVATAPTVGNRTAARFAQRITLGEATMRPDPPEVGTASVSGGPAIRIRVHRVDDPEMSATAAAFPARSRVEDAPADGAVLSLPADA